MLRQGQVVLLDTNVVIEALRARCWRAVAGYFHCETVEKCGEEALTGDSSRPGYVTVDSASLRKGLRKQHPVTDAHRAQLIARLKYPDILDAGEFDLLAYALARPDTWMASCADRAGVNAALELGFAERLVSLEAMARSAGAKPSLKNHFGERWLSDVRTAYKLGQSATTLR